MIDEMQISLKPSKVQKVHTRVTKSEKLYELNYVDDILNRRAEINDIGKVFSREFKTKDIVNFNTEKSILIKDLWRYYNDG